MPVRVSNISKKEKIASAKRSSAKRKSREKERAEGEKQQARNFERGSQDRERIVVRQSAATRDPSHPLETVTSKEIPQQQVGLPQEQVQQEVIALKSKAMPVSTVFDGGGITGSVAQQAARLIEDPAAELKRALLGTVIGASLGIIGTALLGSTAVGAASTVGTTGTSATLQVVGGVASYATNTATVAATTTWLAGLTVGQQIALGTASAGTLVGIIGSYPFSGFIQETL